MVPSVVNCEKCAFKSASLATRKFGPQKEIVGLHLAVFCLS